MAKTKKAAVSKARSSKPVERKPNLFESIYNKKKFDVLGKKSKASLRKRGQARKEGIEKRKGTLLVEYQQRQNANKFQDRRFGENDEGLSAEDKALARFQKQKLKELAGQQPDVDGDEGAVELTHLGAPLRDAFDQDGLDLNNEDEEDYQIDPETEAALHFGGGFQPKAVTAEDPGEAVPPSKSKKEVMEEIMAKSKAFRAQKAKQKEEDQDAAEKLDQDLDEMMRVGALAAFMRPKGKKSQSVPAQDGPDAAYDLARREMAFDSRAKVSERTKTAAELAQEEVQDLEALERERLKRMAGDEVEPADKEPEGGYASRRAKRKREESQSQPLEATGDALEDDFQIDASEEHASEGDDSDSLDPAIKPTLDERRQKRAAGNHPLQESFREAAGSLMQKYGLLESGSDDEDDDRPGSQEDVEDGSGQEGSSASDPESDTEDHSKDRLPNGHSQPRSGMSQSEPDEELGESSAHQEAQVIENIDTAAPAVTAETTSQKASAKSTLQQDVSNLPFSIQAPETFPEFASLVDGRPAEELLIAIQRIRVSTNVALLEENKRKMQVFYGILVQQFAMLAGQSPPSKAHLDVLAVEILELTSVVPLYAATTALARLQRLQERLHTSLASGGRSCWPSQAQLLLLKLWATVFPASDKRHSVLTPALLLIGSHLALCPIQSLQDVKSGLFMASLAIDMAAAASRWMPEPLNFAVRVLKLIFAQPDATNLAIFSLPRSQDKESDESDVTLKLRIYGDTSEISPGQLSESCAVAAVELVGCFAKHNASVPAIPEAIAPALSRLETIASQKSCQAIRLCAQKVLTEAKSILLEVLQKRKPLQKVKLSKEIKQYNPRFEDNFTVGKDYDPDRERAETRKLKRQLKNERRGAIRELRKDASYLGEQRELERHSEEKERKRVLRGNNAWLSKLEQDFKSGGQGGMWKKRKKK